MERPRWHANNVPGARGLRRAPALGERELWEVLRDRRLWGLKFRRQHPIGPFVVDFYCHSLRLIVELDGPVHRTPAQAAFDRRRQAALEALGLHILRLDARTAAFDPAGALASTLDTLAPATRHGPSPTKPLTPGPSPFGRGEEKVLL